MMNNIEIFLIGNGVQTDITEMISSISWGGSKNVAARNLDVTVPHTKIGGHAQLPSKTELEGFGLMCFKDGEEIYRGNIIDVRINNNTITLDTNDHLIYTTKNEEEYLFINKKASEIAKRVFSDFGIPFDYIVDTGYVIPYLSFDGDKIYDIIRKALYLTYQHTNVKYFLTTSKGKARIVKKIDNVKQLVVEEGSNLVDYSYSSTINDVVTKVKLVAGRDKKTITAIAEDAGAKSKFGIIQKYEKVSEELNQAQLKEKADKMLEENRKPKTKLKLDNIIGDFDAVTGSVIYVIIRDLNIMRPYYIEKDSHDIDGNKHLMSLDLLESWDLPEISAGKTEREKEKGKEKGT